MGPLALSDDQMTAVMRASAPLLRHVRSPFLLAVASALGSQPAILLRELHREMLVARPRYRFRGEADVGREAKPA